jgi:16S rRNA G1207 methylase RsmC
MTERSPVHAYDRGYVDATLLGHPFRFLTAHGLFSADRVDDGTRLLLSALPNVTPKSVLDLGCGYGALGLPLAHQWPDALVLLADRDLVAVEYAARNARLHHLKNVQTRGSLGYCQVGEDNWDLVVCNIPARMGERAMCAIMEGGAARLGPRGQLCVVAIHDLCGVMERLGHSRCWTLARGSQGRRHAVWFMKPQAFARHDDDGVYARDRVSVHTATRALELDRPTDINEDPSHLKEGLPLLLECLPRSASPGRALCLRSHYGAAPLALALSGFQVVMVDRDLLATAYTRRNAHRLGLAVDVRESAWLPNAVSGEAFDLVVGEISPSAGSNVARAELELAGNVLKEGGRSLWLGLSGTHGTTGAGATRTTVLATRGGWTVTTFQKTRERRPRRGAV